VSRLSLAVRPMGIRLTIVAGKRSRSETRSMNTKTCLAGLASSILASAVALVSPAFCGPKDALLGKWQMPNRGVIEYFRPDGTYIILERHGKRLIPSTFKGKLTFARYVIHGDKLETTDYNPDPQNLHYWRVVQFKVIKDKLILNRATLAPGFLLPGDPQIITLTRVK